MITVILPLLVFSVSASGEKSSKDGPTTTSSSSSSPPSRPKTKLYATVFPQFHPDPLNDELWGTNFTDWNRLKLSPPRNRYGNPIVRPTRNPLGFYNLNEYSVRLRQRKMAQEYGVDGFLYYHYWWNQERARSSLTGPVERMLLDGEPDLPFAFIWVRAPWSKMWQGQSNDTRYKDNQVLIDVACPPRNSSMIREHYQYLQRFFKNKNHILVNGAPMFVLLDWKLHSDCDDLVRQLQEYAKADGFPAPGIHVVRLHSLRQSEMYKAARDKTHGRSFLDKNKDSLSNSVLFYPYADITPTMPAKVPEYCLAGGASRFHKSMAMGAMPCFDNTPRRKFNSAHMYRRNFSSHGYVADFGYDVVQTMFYERCCQDADVRSRGPQFTVINAWNEWGEGNVLEPSVTGGYQFLETLRRAKEQAEDIGCSADTLRTYNEAYFAGANKITN